jgi:ribosomal protein L11 methyltransferase
VTDSPTAWQIEIDLPDESCVILFDEALGPDAGAVTAREIDNGPRWRLIAHCAGRPDRVALEARVAIAAASAGVVMPRVDIHELPPTDWIAEYRKRIKPVTVGCFFIYPSHYEGDVPDGLVGIHLDAGIAFGTGEHESTSGCLLAMEKLRDSNCRLESGLDMGCGSAILAIALAKLWPSARIVAVDNDPDAVHTSLENIKDNDCSSLIVAGESDGYGGALVNSESPYQIIMANILAGPLTQMAPDAVTHLAPGGYAVLSGILSVQAEAVQTAYEAAGLVLADRLEIGDWTTLSLTKPG